MGGQEWATWGSGVQLKPTHRSGGHREGRRERGTKEGKKGSDRLRLNWPEQARQTQARLVQAGTA